MTTPAPDRGEPMPAIERALALVRRSARHRHAFAILAAILAAALEALAVPFGVTSLPYIVFVPAILVVVLMAGFAPAMLFLGIAIAADHLNHQLWIAWHAINAADLVRALLLALAGGAVAFCVDYLGRARQAALQTADSSLERERRAADRELAARDVLAALPDGLAVLDQQGTVVSFDARAEKIFGWPAAEAVGLGFDLLLAEGHRGEFERQFKLAWSVARSDEALRLYDLLGRQRDGRSFALAMVLCRTELQGEARLYCYLRDESGRKRRNEAVLRVQSRIVGRARLAALAEMGLTLAHQLNQPLAAVSNYILAARQKLSAGSAASIGEVRGLLEKAAEQSLRAGRMIGHARDFTASRGSERQMEPLAELIEEAVALVLSIEGDNEIAIERRYEQPERSVLVDRILIQHAIVSLIQNALQGMARGSRRELRLSTVLREGQSLEVRIADPGTHVPTEALLNLFYPFAPAEDDDSGAGLSIVRSIVQSHGGEVGAISNPNGGSTFYFTLPLAAEPQSIA